MQAFWLAFAENFSSHEWFEDYVGALERVTLDEVLAAANTYLRPQNRITGHFVPVAAPDGAEEEWAEDEEEMA